MSRVPLSAQIVVALVTGLVVGPFVGLSGAGLGEVGAIVIALIKAAATPLLFLSIVNAILKTEVSGRDGLRLFGFASVNAAIALAIGLLLSNWLHPGLHLGKAMKAPPGSEPPPTDKIEFLSALTGHLPQDLVTPFQKNAVLTVVIVALAFGFGLRRARQEQVARGESGYRAIEDGVGTLLRATEAILGWVIRLVPLAVFAVVVKTVGEYGYAPFRGLAAYVGVGLLGLALHVLVTYNVWIAFSRIGLPRFWREAREPIVYAAGANSSLATLPLTLAALDRLGVRKSSSALGACVGTNFNNDGILLYEGMAVLFVAQASGIHLDPSQQVVIAASAVVAAMGVAGVPEAGMVSLALVLNTVGLPTELLPLLLTVDWVIARARSVVNVLSDMVLSILIDGRVSLPTAPR